MTGLDQKLLQCKDDEIQLTNSLMRPVFSVVVSHPNAFCAYGEKRISADLWFLA